MKQSSYEILNIPANATAREIKSSYKKLIRQYTPEHDAEKFMEIREAYEYFTEEHKSDKQRLFPIYKNPLLVISKKTASGNDKVDLSIEILSTVFETPFDLEKSIHQELKKSTDLLGFGAINTSK